jgi:ATP-dependent Lon protease
MTSMRDYRDAKAMAQTLRDSLTSRTVPISHSESLELVSKMLGVADWNTLSALLQSDRRPAPSRPPASPGGRERLSAARCPAVPMRDFAPFPGAVFPLFIGREKSKAAVDEALKSGREVVLAIQMDTSVDEPGPRDIFEIGLLGRLIESERRDNGELRIWVEAGRRVAIRRFAADAGCYQADIEDVGEPPVVEATELVESALQRFDRYAAANDFHMPKSWPNAEQVRDPGRIADVIAMHLALGLEDRRDLLATLDPVARLRRVHDLVGVPSIPPSPAFAATRRRAMASATQRNHVYATLEHLLLALIDDAEAAAVLRACNADLAVLKAELLGFIGSEREDLFVAPGTDAQPSPAFRRVSHRAQLDARALGRAAVTGANALVGLLPETRSPAVRLLDQQGVSAARVAEVVARR